MEMIKVYTCKDCEGKYNFPKGMTQLQAQLHKRKHPSHMVVMILPVNIGIDWKTKQLKEVKKNNVKK